MKLIGKILRWLLVLGASGAAIGTIAAVIAYLYFAPGLPNVAALRDVQFQVPLKVYSADGKLIAEYGEKRRDPLTFKQIPPMLVHAFLSAEDASFYEHPGISVKGLLRATFELIKTGQKRQGGSTITMQLARNFFLSDRKTYSRKIRELFLALKIEKALSKDQILELYLNKIYLGNRAYGVGAAAHVYYGKNVQDLTIAQMAMIAGLPKAPSAFNPIVNPNRALERRGYVLTRMRDLGFITPNEFGQAMKAPITASLHTTDIQAPAPYMAEMVRQYMFEHYGDRAYTDGFKVYTTLSAVDQSDAVRALRDDLVSYTRRHGYRGPEARVSLASDELDQWLNNFHQSLSAGGSVQGPDVALWDQQLSRFRTIGGLRAGLVVKTGSKTAAIYLAKGRVVKLGLTDMSWAGRYINANHVGPPPATVGSLFKIGDVVRVWLDQGRWVLAQVPKVSGALVSLNPHDGAIKALVGGFDYYESKFNRVTQALRQPGSSFKPFVYSAALHDGYTPATLVNDAPVVVNDSALEGVWRPENYERNFNGPTRLRLGLVHSLNLVSIRVLQAIGIDYALNYVSRFGFDPARLPHNLTLALGSASVTPLEMATGYAVFANGGYQVKPYFINRVVAGDGSVLFQAHPETVCEPNCPASQRIMDKTTLPVSSSQQAGGSAMPISNPMPVDTPSTATVVRPAKRVISKGNAYQMISMMKDVIRMGTGRAALSLHRSDLAGKTGTTNQQVDAWFSGFDADLVTSAWVGFDDNQPLGHGETGARAALPMWMAYMGAALQGKPEASMAQPPGIVTVKIDPKTGLLANPGETDAIFETFRKGHLPKPDTPEAVSGTEATPQGSRGLTQQLY